MQMDDHFNRKVKSVHFKGRNELYPSTIYIGREQKGK